MSTSDLQHLNARKVQMNFSIDPELFVRFCDFVKTKNSSSRSSVLAMIIKMFVGSPEEIKAYAKGLRPAQVEMMKGFGTSIAIALREIEGK